MCILWGVRIKEQRAMIKEKVLKISYNIPPCLIQKLKLKSQNDLYS
jgi:hypothetical protein